MKIVVSMGDCNGIGLEAFFRALEVLGNKKTYSNPEITVAANRDTLFDYTDKLKIPIISDSTGFFFNKRYYYLLDLPDKSPVEFGKETFSAGKLAASAVETSLELTLKNEYDAMVTLPVNKSSLYVAGWKYPGHTEFLAAECHAKGLMILFHGKTRVALVTVHIPLKEVPTTITPELILEKATQFNSSLKKDFGIASPKFAVLGLNPHAGEGGALGSEENEIIQPAIKKCRDENINAFGPFPADGFFAHSEARKYDGILAMYHDQGLIPLKYMAKGGGVNFTAGLPVVRTSPDHGTAFNIAGKGLASGKSTAEAIEAAVEIWGKRNKK